MGRVGKFFTMPPDKKPAPAQQASLSDMWGGGGSKKVKKEESDGEDMKVVKEGVDGDGSGPSGSQVGSSSKAKVRETKANDSGADEDVQMDSSEVEVEVEDRITKVNGNGKGKKKAEAMEVDEDEENEKPKKGALRFLTPGHTAPDTDIAPSAAKAKRKLDAPSSAGRSFNYGLNGSSTNIIPCTSCI